MTIPTYFNVGQTLYASGVGGMTELNGRELTILDNSGAPTVYTFAVSPSEDDYTGTTNLDSTGYGTFTSGGTLKPIVEIAHPYAAADLDQVQFVQSDDVMYFVHPNYPVYKLVRFDDQTWTINVVAFKDGPYLGPGQGQTGGGEQLTYTLAGGILNVTAGGGVFAATDVGRLIRVLVTGVWYWGKILTFNSSTQVRGIGFSTAGTNDNIGIPDGTVIASTDWRFGKYYPTSYPTAAVFHQNRLVLAGANSLPNSFDGSNTADFENFTPTSSAGAVTASNAYSFNLASYDYNGIKWCASDEKGLIMGTTSSEWIVTSGDTQSALSALSVSANKTTATGGAAIQAVQIGKCTLYVQKGGTKVRELQSSNYTIDGFVSNDLTQWAEHITGTSAVLAAAGQRIPQPIVWIVRADGVLAAMTYERDLEALKVGWSRHILGGTVSGGGNAIVESCTVISSDDGTSQDLWVTVKRFINGHTLRYVEKLTPFFDNNNPTLTSAKFLDSNLTYSGAATTTISGLNHLNGQTVTIWADGLNVGTSGVVNGRLTLATAASIVTIGLPYNSRGQKLRSDAGATDGTAFGKTRRIHKVGFEMLNTQGFQLGPDFNTLDTLSLDGTTAGTLANPAALFTGIVTEPISNNYDFDNMFCWQQSGPHPGTILGIFPQIVTQDR